MSKTALEIAKVFKIKHMDDFPDDYTGEFDKDFDEFCEALCKEQRRICALTLEAVALSPEKDVYEVINNAPTPKWREE